jgi:hypothetical protein
MSGSPWAASLRRCHSSEGSRRRRAPVEEGRMGRPCLAHGVAELWPVAEEHGLRINFGRGWGAGNRRAGTLATVSSLRQARLRAVDRQERTSGDQSMAIRFPTWVAPISELRGCLA